MSASIIDGKATSKAIQAEIKIEVAELQEKHGLVPGLAVVLPLGRRQVSGTG